MTSIYQYNRNGIGTNTTNAAGSSSSNKATSNARGRTESPSMRARYTRLASGSTNDPVDIPANRTPRTQASTNGSSSRNPPERISANPAQSFSKVNALATSYLNKTGLVSTANLTPRRYKVVEADTSKTAAKTNLTKARLNEFDNHMQQGSNNLGSKPQKYLSTHSNLNQMQNHHNSQQQQQHNQYTSNGSALEDDFANSLYLNHNNNSNAQRIHQTSGYNIITHETADTNARYSHQQSSMGNSCATHGSLLRAAQSKQVSSSQFYPAQQQQMLNGSYKTPTIPSNSSVSGSSSNSSAAQHSYYVPTAADVNSNVQQFEADNHELTYKGIVGLKNLGNTVSSRLILQTM